MSNYRRICRLAENQTGKRQVVVVIRERDGRTVPAVFPSEDAAVLFIKARVQKGTVLHADESPAWNALHARFVTYRIDHGTAYSRDGACTNGAESYFSRLRRAEMGHHHHVSGPYLRRYAQEMAWREDYRRVDNGRQFNAVLALVAAYGHESGRHFHQTGHLPIAWDRHGAEGASRACPMGQARLAASDVGSV